MTTARAEHEALVRAVRLALRDAWRDDYSADSVAEAVAFALTPWLAAQVQAARREAVREYIETKEMPVVRIETKPEWERIATEVRAAALKEQREGIADLLIGHLHVGPHYACDVCETVVQCSNLARTYTQEGGE